MMDPIIFLVAAAIPAAVVAFLFLKLANRKEK
jgi:hypothetical protein